MLLKAFLFLLFPITAFAAGGFQTTAEILASLQPADTTCSRTAFENALSENAGNISENDSEYDVRQWIYSVMMSPETLGDVLSCPEIVNADDTDTFRFMPKYTFPNGREIVITYETQPRVLEQHFMLANKTELPTNDPNPELSPDDPHATWVNTDPAWYGIMVVQSGALHNFVGPDKNNIVSQQYIVDNIERLYPQNSDGWCSTKTGIGAKANNAMVHDVIRERTAKHDGDKNNYYIAGDRDLRWIAVTEIVAEIVLTIVTWGGAAAASGGLKMARAGRIMEKIGKNMKNLVKIERVQEYIRHSLKVAKYTKEIDNMTDMAKYIRNIDKLEKTLAKTAKGTKRYEKIAKQLETARKLKADNMWKLGKAGNGIDKVEDIEKLTKMIDENRKAITDTRKIMSGMEKEKDVAEYVKQFNTLKDVSKYARELKAFKKARTGNVFSRAWQGIKNIGKSVKTANTGGKTLDRAARVARQGAKSGRARDWLFHATLRNAGRITRATEEIAALTLILQIAGDFFDWTDISTDEFTNGIDIRPLLLLSADNMDDQDNVVNYGMWMMWSGDSTNPADDDAAYLQAMDFAQKFYQDLTEFQDETNRHACNVDIYVVRPIIRNPGTQHQQLYWMFMNDEPWSTSNSVR
jgi:hypothetical protein